MNARLLLLLLFGGAWGFFSRALFVELFNLFWPAAPPWAFTLITTPIIVGVAIAVPMYVHWMDHIK